MILATCWLLYHTRVRLPRDIEERFQSSLQAFGKAIELRAPEISGATPQIAELALKIGREMQLSPNRLRNLQMAAELRHIGLCAIPYELLNSKPRHLWNEGEAATFKRHTHVCGAMLELVPSLSHLAEIARWQESDFSPDLPIESRILRVAAEYIWTERSHGVRLAEIHLMQKKGAAFCPDVVDALGQLNGFATSSEPASYASMR